ncbi:GGDEF domain-containing response regulator [Arcobacter roscoffensis]|uniref:diguanylate cyclase n=1 Tax=Arcobacter roscoffensis TaxID=2961520 RepID=A0ABY5E7R0_9BACT|nr:diguanylate cyclase [Arcobacter roscoffensis]UTJ07098.1 diguanylate cyclase [Arcobacter roscoffensis]
MKKINKELLSNLTVLYVEDEDMIREEVTYFLNRNIPNFHTAKNGEEGYELFHKINPDLIITDIQMPKMNGIDMLKKINKKSVPVIVTTAYSDLDYFLKAIELQVNKFVIKPIDLMQLIYDIQDCFLTNHLRDQLFEKDNLLEIVDENVLLSITDKHGVIIDASSAFSQFVGYDKTELIGNKHSLLRHEDTPDEFYENMWNQIHSGKVFSSEIKNRKKDGEVYWANLTITPAFNNGEIVNFTAIRQDITDNKKLQLLSIEDDLTKLYNRRHFNEILEKEIRRIKRENINLSLLSLDIDHFKKYNDTYGHPKGDEILKQVAKALKESTSRATDYVFRVGGEEFCIIFSGLDIEDSMTYAKQIVKNIENLKIEHVCNSASEYVTISAGLIVQNSKYIEDEEELYKASDKALYKAKVNGRNQVYLSNKSK